MSKFLVSVRAKQKWQRVHLSCIWSFSLLKTNSSIFSLWLRALLQFHWSIYSFNTRETVLVLMSWLCVLGLASYSDKTHWEFRKRIVCAKIYQFYQRESWKSHNLDLLGFSAAQSQDQSEQSRRETSATFWKSQHSLSCKPRAVHVGFFHSRY